MKVTPTMEGLRLPGKVSPQREPVLRMDGRERGRGCTREMACQAQEQSCLPLILPGQPPSSFLREQEDNETQQLFFSKLAGAGSRGERVLSGPDSGCLQVTLKAG